MRALITYGLFPVTFAGALTAGHLAHQRGVHEGLVVTVITAITIVIIAVCERIHPCYSSWNRARGDVGTDLAHGAVSMISLPPLLEGGLRALLLTLVIPLAGADRGWWPDELPIAAQLGLALLVSQFGEYWVHRGMHETNLLWRLHATHHSPERLYWLNASRFHPLDTAMSFTSNITPLIILGVPREVMMLMTIWIAVHGLFQHCNIHLRLGPLNYIFSMAELHRWHHSLSVEEANHNYGNNIILWDLVFGTFYWPKDRAPPEQIGISDGEFPKGYVGQIMSPFRAEHWTGSDPSSG